MLLLDYSKYKSVLLTAFLNYNLHAIKISHCKSDSRISAKFILGNNHCSPAFEHLHYRRNLLQNLVLLIVYELC